MTTTEPLTHYSPPTKLAGDAVLACGTEHWQIVSGNPAQVTCQPCQDPIAQCIATARAARRKTSVNNPLNGHIDALAAGLAAVLRYHHPRPLREDEVISWVRTPAGQIMVCFTCRDDAGETTQWPCLVHRDVTAALAGAPARG
jgi:hypothetical protein